MPFGSVTPGWHSTAGSGRATPTCRRQLLVTQHQPQHQGATLPAQTQSQYLGAASPPMRAVDGLFSWPRGYAEGSVDPLIGSRGGIGMSSGSVPASYVAPRLLPRPVSASPTFLAPASPRGTVLGHRRQLASPSSAAGPGAVVASSPGTPPTPAVAEATAAARTAVAAAGLLPMSPPPTVVVPPLNSSTSSAMLFGYQPTLALVSGAVSPSHSAFLASSSPGSRIGMLGAPVAYC